MRAEVHSSDLERTVKMTREWRQRARALQRRFLKRAVDKVFEDLLANIPSDRETLRDSLRVDRIRGLGRKVSGFSIHAATNPVRAVRGTSDSVVVYVAAKPHLMQQVPRATTLLAEFSPWTLDTLPYSPDPKTAEIISRRVSRREVDKVTRARKKDRAAVRKLMKEAGIRGHPVVVPSKEQGVFATPDVAFESLRLEFGLGDMPSKPHWRKSILKLALRGGIGRIAKKREFIYALTQPSYQRWRAWLKEKGRGISVAQARQYVPFQKRLGLRVGRR